MRGRKQTINLAQDEDPTTQVERIRRECRLNGFKVVDYDLDEDTVQRYVVIQKVVKPKTAPKKRFFV